MAKLISNIYGDAIFNLAVEKNTVEALYDEAKAVLSSFKDNGEMTDFFAHPKISKENKIQFAEDVFGKFTSKDMTGFLVTIIEKDRASEIENILTYFISRVMDYMKIGVAFVTTPTELSKEVQKKVTDRLLEVTDYKEFQMHFSVDESLIGGMVIRVGDRVIDSSIKSKLNKLAKSLYKTDVI